MSLIEVLIAVFIVSIGMLATLSLLTWCRIHNDLEQERARAHQVVSQEMEQVRHELFTRVTAGQTITIWNNGTPDDTTDDTQGTLEVVMRDPDTGNTLLTPPDPARRVEVEVTLSWSPRGRLSGKTYRESVMTYLSP